MVSKRDKDAESGLQILTVISIIWAVGFLYWSRSGTVLGYDAGNVAYICCSSMALVFPIVISAIWISTRKENRAKKFLDGHLKISDSVSADDISLRFNMKRPTSVRVLRSWMASSGIPGDYDETTGIFRKKMD